MKQALCEYISMTLLDGDPDLSVQPEDNLLEAGMLDSLQLMRLVHHVETETGIKIPPADLVLENFETVNAIVKYLDNR